MHRQEILTSSKSSLRPMRRVGDSLFPVATTATNNAATRIKVRKLITGDVIIEPRSWKEANGLFFRSNRLNYLGIQESA